MNSNPQSRVVLEVDLGALSSNFTKIKSAVAPLGVVAVLKANAYGLGMPEIARRLADSGAAAIAVAELSEGLEALDATGGKIPVLVLGSILPDEIEPAVKAGMRIPIASAAEADAVSKIAKALRKTALCHIVVDTGMSRTGFRPDEAVAQTLRTNSLAGLSVEGLYSHFPTANIPGDRDTALQVKTVRKINSELVAAGINLKALHIANSDGINNVPSACRAPFTHVRAGINLHGSFDPIGNRRLRLQPVMTLKARLAQVRTVPAGSTLGYGRTFCLPRDTLVGTVAAGYADGLPLALSNRGSILVGGVPCPVIGRICMDYTTVSLEQVPNARPGDDAVCLGRQGTREISIDEWASLKGTHPYEVLCAIGSRVKRTYKESIVSGK